MMARSKGVSLLHLLFVVVASVLAVFVTVSAVDQKAESTEINNSIPEGVRVSVQNFITSNPVDLSQISMISKFRSCAGHDASGLNRNGIVEYNRSMKHYFAPTFPLSNSTGMIKVFSPFDGNITYIAQDFDRGYEIHVASPLADWQVILYHTDPVDGLKVGMRVVAGQLVGYAHVKGGSDFDIGLEKIEENSNISYDSKFFTRALNESEEERRKYKEIFKRSVWRESIFVHMDPSVLAEYEKSGVNISSLIKPKEERDSAPCKCVGEDCRFEETYGRPEDWVILKK